MRVQQMVRRLRGAAVLALLVALLAGCGGPKYDATVFVMPQSGLASEMAEKLQTSLQSKFGETPLIGVISSPIFSMEKLIVEIAAGEHSVLVIPEREYQVMVEQKGPIPLDDTFDKSKYPAGVSDGTLYGIPVHESAWMKEIGYRGDPLFAFIPANAKDQEQAKKVLKAIVE